MKQFLTSRWLTFLLLGGFTCWLASAAAGDPGNAGRHFKQQKPKPAEEEEETPKKPAKKPDKKTEEEEEAPKPKPQTPTARPIDGPVNLAEEAKRAEHEQIRKLFEEFAQPFDRVRAKSGKTWPRVAPFDVRFDTTTRAQLKLTELTKDGKDGQEVTLPRESIDRVEYYEHMILERVQKELLQDKLAGVPRSALLRRAEMLLSEALRFSTKAGVRKGDSWDKVRLEIAAQLRSSRIELVRALTDERKFVDAVAQARHLYDRKEPNEIPFAADRNLLDAIEYLYVTQTRALVNQSQYLQARLALEEMFRRFTNVQRTPSIEAVQSQLQTRAQELVQSGNALAEQKQYSQALQMLVKAEEAWPALPGLRERRQQLEGLYPVLRVGVRHLPAQMSPTTVVSDADRMASKLIFESFLELRAGPSARDGYAYKLGLDMPRAREGVWDLVLSPDVVWSDGKPFTAADVKRSIEFLCDERTPYYDPTASLYLTQPNGNRLDGVRVEDNHRLTLAFSKAHLDPFALMAFDLIPNHKFDPGASPRNTAFGANPVGTGPFVYGSAEGNEKVFLANPHYRRPHAPRGPAIREIRFVKYDDANLEQAKQDVLSGRLQMLLDLSTAQAETLRGNSAVELLTPTRPPENTQGVYLTNPRVYFVAPNHRKPELQNAELRKGIAWAIDRESILNKLFRHGDGKRFHQSLSSPFPVGCWAQDPEKPLPPNPFRLDQAKGFLDAARNKLGNLPALTLKYPQEDSDAAGACAMIQTMLDAAGLKVTPQPVARVQLAAELLKESPDFDLVYWHYDYDSETLSLWPLFDPNSAAGRNFMGYTRDGDLAGYLQRLLAYRDLGRLADELYQLNAYFYQNMIVAPLWQLDRHVIVHRSLKPTRLHPIWVFQNVEEWQLGR